MTKITCYTLLLIYLLSSAQTKSALFFANQDGRHWNPLVSIAKEFNKIRQNDLTINFMDEEGKYFKMENNGSLVFDKIYNRLNHQVINLPLIETDHPMLYKVRSQYELIQRVIKETNVSIAVVDMLSFGAILGVTAENIPLVKHNPWPLIDPENDPDWFPTYFSSAPFMNNNFYSIKEFLLRKIQYVIFHAGLAYLNLGLNVWNHVTIVDTVFGYEIPRLHGSNFYLVGPIFSDDEPASLNTTKDIILIDFGGYGLNITHQTHLKAECINFCDSNAVTFLWLGGSEGQNTSCITYSNASFDSLIENKHVKGVVISSEHIKVSRTIAARKPFVATVPSAILHETTKRMDFWSVGQWVHLNTFLSNTSHFFRLCMEFKSKEQSTHMSIILSHASKTSKQRAAEIINLVEMTHPRFFVPASPTAMALTLSYVFKFVSIIIIYRVLKAIKNKIM